MSDKITFDYFYGQESEMHTFYRVPKALFDGEAFSSLSLEAKFLYSFMLDRMSLSQKNKWIDKENRAYIHYAQQEAMAKLGCKENKAINLFRELEAFGLMERKKQGQGKPTIIYLKDFIEAEVEDDQTLEKPMSEPETEEIQTFKKSMSEQENDSDIDKIKVKTWEKSRSRHGLNQGQDMGKINPINNNTNNTNKVIITNHISSIVQGADADVNSDYYAYAEIIREQIDLDAMLERYPQYREDFESAYDLILETVLSTQKTIHIAKNDYPRELVKSKFLKLDHTHLEYVMDCMKHNTTKIRDIKSYMLAALFNAPTTMSSYYQAEVNHDRMYGT